ncbi:MAG: hypothetical protein J6U93_03575 [Alistipes sp.]|nr:hypothetical protein [Alistipes sp.]
MVNKLIAILFGIIFVGCAVGAFFFGRATARTDIVRTEVERDTIVVRDTISEYYPQEVERVVVRTERVEVPVIVRDTIRDTVYVNLPIEEREYKSRNYRVVIGGFNPYLKSIDVHPQTIYINATESITTRKRWSFMLGVQGGYGITPMGWQPYAGFGGSFGYSF